MRNQKHDAAEPLERLMKNVIESAAKNASGEPVWQLIKGQFIIEAGKFILPGSEGSVNERISLLEERVDSIERAKKRYL